MGGYFSPCQRGEGSGEGRTMQVGFIVEGHSGFDDAVWSWLGAHRNLFYDEEKESDLDSWDYIRAVGVLVLAGCTVRNVIDYNFPKRYQTAWGEQLCIEFDGTCDTLLRRLNKLVRP